MNTLPGIDRWAEKAEIYWLFIPPGLYYLEILEYIRNHWFPKMSLIPKVLIGMINRGFLLLILSAECPLTQILCDPRIWSTGKPVSFEPRDLEYNFEGSNAAF